MRKTGASVHATLPTFYFTSSLASFQQGRKSQHHQYCCLPYTKPTVIPMIGKLPLTVITQVSDQQLFKGKIPAVPTFLICSTRNTFIFFLQWQQDRIPSSHPFSIVKRTRWENCWNTWVIIKLLGLHLKNWLWILVKNQQLLFFSSSHSLSPRHLMKPLWYQTDASESEAKLICAYVI